MRQALRAGLPWASPGPDEAYLVTTHEVPALHQAKQMIRYMLDSGYPQANIRLILNRVPKRLDVTLDEIEQMLGLPIFATLANDYQALQDAYVEGRLVDSNSHLGKSFVRLAAKIAGVADEKKKKFVPLQTDGLRCSRDGIITADGGR